jgi:hypothetical protein
MPMLASRHQYGAAAHSADIADIQHAAPPCGCYFAEYPRVRRYAGVCRCWFAADDKTDASLLMLIAAAAVANAAPYHKRLRRCHADADLPSACFDAPFSRRDVCLPPRHAFA